MKKLVAYALGLLLVALPLLGVLAQEASAASSRVAVVKELKGTVKVKKSGGSKEFTAFAKMSLNEGDILTVGAGGSAVLQFANGSSEDDQMTVSANTTLTFSKLKEGKNTVTKVSVQNGSVWSTVKSIKSANDEFTLETPTAIMGVRGTNLFASVDPVTGDSRFIIASGIGQIVPTNKRTNATPPNVFVFPNQQLTVDDRNQTDEFPNEVVPVDLSAFVNNLSPEIIEAILKAKNAIDQENEEFINKKKKELEDGQTDSSLELNTVEDLNRITQNLYNLVANMLQEALRSQKIAQAELQKLIDEANQTLNKKIDLPNTPPPALTELEKRKQELLKQREQARLEAAKKQKEADLQRQLEEMIKKLADEKKKQEEANQKALEEKKNKAKEEYAKKLAEAEKKLFEEESKKREQELKDRTTTPSVAPSPTTGGGGGGGNGGGGSSPNPTPTPNPLLPNGITSWTMTTPNDQPLAIQRTKQSENNNVYAVQTTSVLSSLKLKLVFGSNVTKVTLMRQTQDQSSIEWNASGEVQTIEGLEEGYNQFRIYVTKTQPDSSSGELVEDLFVINGDIGPNWSELEQPFGLENASYSKDGDLFRAEVPMYTEGITLFQSDYRIEKVKVNGVELTNPYAFFDIQLIPGDNHIAITLADAAYYYKHSYTLIVNRSAHPVGIVSWTIETGGQSFDIIVSNEIFGNESFAYATLPSPSQGATLKVELAEGYIGQVIADEEPIGNLQQGVNPIPLDLSSIDYYRYHLEIYDSEYQGSTSVLTIQVGNAAPTNSNLNAGGIELESGGQPLGALNYAGGYDFVGVFSSLPSSVELITDIFTDNFNPPFLTQDDVQMMWNNEKINVDGWAYYLHNLEPGLNRITVTVDPLRQFGPNAPQYNLDIYNDSMPQSLKILSLEAVDSYSNQIAIQSSGFLNYSGQFQSGTQYVGPVTFRVELNSGTTPDIEWLLNSQSGVTSVAPVQGTSAYTIEVSYSGAQPLQLQLPVIDSNGISVKYDVLIDYSSTDLGI